MRSWMIAALVCVAACKSGSAAGPAKAGPTVNVDVLADHLVNGDPVAAYSPKTKTAVYVTGWNEEGTGAGRAVVFESATGDEDRVEIFAPGDDEAAGIKAKRPDVVKRLKDKGFVDLERIDWQQGARTLVVTGIGLELSWENDTLMGAKNGGRKTPLHKFEPEEPHTPSPTGVYWAKDVEVILVEVTFDPGEAYADGFNVFTEIHAVAIPK